MAIEIERKYLVIADRLPPLHNGERIVQAYIPTANRSTVRVRLCDARAYLTLKGPSQGISRAEFEYHIPLADAQDILAGLCGPERIEKTRYDLMYQGMHWEVDVFEGANAGLILAEIELPSETTPYELPGWVGADVSADLRYSNQALMSAPWPQWANRE
ncbi:MAG: CYTH domain-containing protein [Pseudomonadales bacterium]|nr:CYTH domain-containing protein [Pseudomonadales bacterium]MCP5329681.1 CYTH domain-containing protein [Pseudomonadales bacterium]MCP5343780.1 CYTH domain-containing protein [Pseudomonadales bacterium]